MTETSDPNSDKIGVKRNMEDAYPPDTPCGDLAYRAALPAGASADRVCDPGPAPPDERMASESGQPPSSTRYPVSFTSIDSPKILEDGAQKGEIVLPINMEMVSRKRR